MSTFDPRAIARRTQLPPRDEPSGPVLVSLDGSRAGWRAMEWAAGEAAARGSALRVVHTVAVPLFPADPWQWWQYAQSLGEAAYEVARAELADAVVRVREIAPLIDLSTELVPGPPAAGLRADVRSNDALVVVGRRRGARHLPTFAPSVAWGAVRRAAQPAAVVDLADSWEPGPSMGRVLVALDGTSDPSPVLDVAFRAAARRGAGITVLYAWGGGMVIDVVDELLDPYRRAFPTVEVRHREARRLARALAAEAHGAAVTVVAASGGGWDLVGRYRVRRLVGAVRGPVTLVPLVPTRLMEVHR